MSEANKEKATAATLPPPPEDQSQRWMKYGANVVLATVIVLVLAGFVIWLAQAQDLKLFGHRFSMRVRPDLTSNASNSLKPQTEAVVKDLPEKITLVSLYPKLKQEERGQKEDTYERVLNVLEQYRSRNPDKVQIEAIDPITEPAKLDAWIGRLKRDYGQNVSAYEDLLKGFPKTLEQIRAVAAGEEKETSKLSQGDIEASLAKLPQEQQEKLVNTVNGAITTVRTFPQILDAINENIKTELDKKIPDYAAGRDMLVSFLSQFSARNRLVSERLAQLRDDKATPPAIAAYAKNSIPGFDEMKRIADETTAKAKALGKLKLEDVRRKLIPADDTEAPPPAIVVMGKEDIRVIDFDSVWKSGDSTGLIGASSEKPRLRFAGEQQITSAMLALSQAKKKKVAFVRDGGPPPTDPRNGPAGLGDIADRLRAYNFEVLEKDISGQWAQQQMQQSMRMGMPPAPEPPDDELKDAVWVVLPGTGSMETGGPSPMMAQKLKQHLEPDDKGKDLAVDAKDPTLVRSAARKFTADDKGDTLEIAATGAWKAGKYKVTDVREDAAVLDAAPAPAGATGGQWEAVPGSAMCLMTLHGDDLASVLRSYGVEVNTNAIVVHEPIDSASGTSDDFIETARRSPPIFVINQYGDHPITTPLNSLDGVIVPMLPVKKIDAPGANVSLILPVPQQPMSWGETDFDSFQRGRKPTFDKGKDIEGPLWAGAVAEKKGAGKLVVIGSRDWATTSIVRFPDQRLQKQRLEVARFPGNGELFTNSVFWLANQESMIALSPSAMDTSRIAAMSPGALTFWRVGIFLIGLPVAALLCGLFVYQSRRD